MGTEREKAMAGFDPDRLIDAVAPTLGLTVTEVQRPGVARFLAVAHEMARLVMAAPLPDDRLELASTFRPGRSDGD